MTIRRALRLAAACLALTAFSFTAAPSAPAQAQASVPAAYSAILGAWNCSVGDDQQYLRITTAYAMDGTFQSRGVSRAVVPRGVLELTMSLNGTWAIEGDQLTEVGVGYSLDSASLGGQPILPGSPEWTNMNASIQNSIGEPNVRTIVSVDAQTLNVAYQGQPLSCTRA